MNTARSILLIEDNPDDEALTLAALRDSAIANELLVVRDGAKALEMFEESSNETSGPAQPLPALILLDLNLPKIGGLEVLRRLRANERTKLVPIVVMTTSTEERDVTASYSGGANGYVRKPIDFVQFAEAVRGLGLYWLVLNEPPQSPGTSS